MKYTKKLVPIEISEPWLKIGDHPDVEQYDYFRCDTVSCARCEQLMAQHGWVKTFEGGYIVCPGDRIVTGVQGEKYPIKPDIFELTYEPALLPQGNNDGLLTPDEIEKCWDIGKGYVCEGYESAREASKRQQALSIRLERAERDKEIAEILEEIEKRFVGNWNLGDTEYNRFLMSAVQWRAFKSKYQEKE